MSCGDFSVGKGNILLPIDDGARAITKTVGEQIHVEVMFNRDMTYHRRVFATMRELAQAIGQNPEWVRAQLLVYCGLFHVVGQLDGSHVVAVSSMSRHSMRDEELRHFWQDAQEHIEARLLPLITNEVVRDRMLTAITSF